MLKWEYQKDHKTALDSRVCWAVVNICRLWDYMDDFVRLFPLEMHQVKSGNHIRAELIYKLQHKAGTDIAEVWHYAANGDPDRHLMTIRFTPADTDLF